MSQPNAHYTAERTERVTADDSAMIVMIEIKSVYGELKAYPANRIADHFALIAGTKTLTRNTLLNVLAMGCQLIEVDRYGHPMANHTAAKTFPVAIR